MPSTISAGTTAGTALNFTSDTTGNLSFQTNGTTTAMTIDTSQNVTFANNVTYSGTITAGNGFSGSGAGLSSINASNVTSGTLASARLPSSGINASAITTGTLAVAQGGTGGLLPVANGGTGTSTPSLVAGSGIAISGSWPNQTVATTGGGASLQFSLATRDSARNSSGTPLVFNSTGNLTWTAPTGVTRVTVTVIGGGVGINNFGGYNGAGGIGIGNYAVTPGTAYSVTVGAASAGLTGTSPVGAGGTSSFGALISATGGSGGNGGGTNGSSANANIRRSNVNDWGGSPFGGQQPSENGTGGRSATISWAFDTQNSGSGRAPSPGATNPDSGFSVSGLVYIEWVG